jgi:hypothetical protein
MGQNQSITQSNTQQTINNISQISNEKCVNLCLNESSFKIDIEGSKTGNINVGEACAINGTSCVLKAAFSQTLVNKLANVQKGSVSDEEDFSNFLNTLAEAGSNQSVDQNNYQAVTNNSTQQLNGLCMNKAENSGKPVVLKIINDKTGNINLSNTQQVSNTQCTITNTGTASVTNDLSNSQSASLTREGMFGGMMLIAAIVAVALILRHKKTKNKQMNELLRAKAKNLNTDTKILKHYSEAKV